MIAFCLLRRSSNLARTHLLSKTSSLPKQLPGVRSNSSIVHKCFQRITPGRVAIGIGLGVGAFSVKWSPVVQADVVEIGPEEVASVIEAKKPEDDNFDWHRLWSLLSPDKFCLAIAIASAFVVALLNIYIPISLGQLTNVLSQFVTNHEPWTWPEFILSVKEPSLKLLAMYLIQSGFTFVNIATLTVLGEKMATRLRQNLFFSVMIQDIAFFDSIQSGEIVNRLTSDVQDFKSAFKLCVSQGLKSITQSIGCACALYVISPKMTVLMASVVSTLVVIGSFLGSFLRVMSRKAQAQIGKATAVANEAIGNVRTVRAFARENETSEAYNKEVRKSEKLLIDLGLGIGAFQSLTNLALNGIVLGTLLFGGYLLSNNELSAGNLMSFLVATQTVQRSLSQLSLLYGQYMKAVTSGSRVFAYLDMQPTLPVSGGLVPSEVLGKVEFRNVSFRYPTRPEQSVLRRLDLTLEPGKVTAVCGLSGAGKSTLGVLLERFYDVESGAVLIDGNDLRKLDPAWLRGHLIGYINQEPTLFATSIKENIRYARPDATDEEVYDAAKLANADNFIRSFPSGYETVVGERGVAVSGGQKQRIAIARAILKNPSILILDEATSALDSHSERLVHEALERVGKGKTVLVIAHRLSTIRGADVIAVLSAGRLVEIGNHDSLIKKKGAYWELVKKQEQDQDSTRLQG